MIKRILITPGEPAGIGPDISIQAAFHPSPHEWVVIADPVLLTERAVSLNLPLKLIEIEPHTQPSAHIAGQLKILPILTREKTLPGQLNIANAQYVLNTLNEAARLCQNGLAEAIVTGPVHKGVMNEAGIPFTGHTEFFADFCAVKKTVMLFVVNEMKVALLTTHLPLAKVPSAISPALITETITILKQALKAQFHIPQPRILVCGLNPHAGENGYLGREEIDIITPALNQLRKNDDFTLEGPLPADTIFTKEPLARADAILAMYHDQALPLVKYIGFDHAVNMTLGLPFIRTSVDHGTALDKAASGKANPSSLLAALALTSKLIGIAQGRD